MERINKKSKPKNVKVIDPDEGRSCQELQIDLIDLQITFQISRNEKVCTASIRFGFFSV